ncbi:MAG TPA: methyltransferase domain-containing protein [Candidatus Sulfotelmatobacter sp.]|nr:methyltransferase domain-containing protein [Candidatus Sulfotelmatobacter sp.]
MADGAYHTTRFAHDPRRALLWRTLVECVFQKDIPPDAAVLDLGAGYGDFINAVKARRRLAVDIWPGMLSHLDKGVEGLVTGVAQLDALTDASLDYVFSSNCFEHISQDELVRCLGQLQRKMKPGARLTIVQPNFTYSFRQYFDDYTHVSIYTAQGLSDLLAANGFRVVRCLPRFLPLTIKSRLPVSPLFIRLYLLSPIKPFAGQMLVSAIR